MTDIAKLSKEGDISIIKLDDGKANAFSFDMLSTVQGFLNEIPKDSGAVVITGRTGLFSGGFDLKTLASGDAEAAMKMTSLGFKTLLDLYSFPRPIVAAVSGHAVALGLFTVCCADIRIGVEGKFVLQANEVRNNMDIPVQILEIIKDRLDKKHYYKALYHSDTYTPTEAVTAGLLDEVVPANKLMETALERANDLATLPHPHYEKTKQYSQKLIVERILEALNQHCTYLPQA